jgi:hypothetical protein
MRYRAEREQLGLGAGPAISFRVRRRTVLNNVRTAFRISTRRRLPEVLRTSNYATPSARNALLQPSQTPSSIHSAPFAVLASAAKVML